MEMMVMMSSQDSGPPRFDYDDCADHGGGAGFLEMLGDLHSSSGSGDLFELVWQGGGPAGRSCTPEIQAGGDILPSSPLLPADHQPRPSEEEMAAWLRAIIVRGDDAKHPAVVGLGKLPAGRGAVAGCAAVEDDQPVATATTMTVDKGSNSSQRRKQRARRSPQHSETHSLTEKRRRCKINDKFKTLQKLVPGCDDKSNQTSTLEQTIKHMKSLQHQIQVQAMSFGCRIEPPAPAAVVMPPAAFAPGVLARGGHVLPGLVLGPPPPAMPLPFAATSSN